MTPWILFASIVIALQWIQIDSRFIEGAPQIDRSLWAPPDAYLLNITNESSGELDDSEFELPQEKLARSNGRNNRANPARPRSTPNHQHPSAARTAPHRHPQRTDGIRSANAKTVPHHRQPSRAVPHHPQPAKPARNIRRHPANTATHHRQPSRSRTRPSATKTAHNQQWHDPSCNIQCNRNDMKSAPLVIISFDGFANQYRRRKLVPSLERMGECGASAPHMYPSYPSKTFPNHYTIATGLYPESHGIIDNYVYDPRISPKVEDVRTWKGKGQYFRGEPIWSSAVRQGKKMYCLHYPGCSYNITGYNPTVDIKFTQEMNFVQKIDQMTTWLKQPQSTRPDLIMAYFNQPDETGHHKRTDNEVDLELRYVEGIIDWMLSQFKKENLLDCINLVILSDHGMQTLNKRFYINTMMNTRGMLTSNGVIGRIYRGTSPYTPEATVDHLKCKNERFFRVYDRRRIPTRYHYSRARRIGDIILEGRPGTIFFETKAQEYSLTSDHGYDYIEDNMKAIFFARGPNIRPRTKLPPFQNVELYNLFSDLLQLRKDVPTNGTEGFMAQALNRIQAQTPTSPKKQFTSINECLTLSLNSNFRVCSRDSSCQSSVSSANQKMSGCSNRVNLNGLFESSDGLCQMKWCSVAVVKSPSAQYGTPTITYEFLEATKQLLYSRSNDQKGVCSFVDTKYDIGCSNWTSVFKDESQYRQLEWHSILAGRDSGIHRSADLQFLVYKNFAEGTLNWLQKWTREYAKKYGKIGVLTAAVYDYNMDGLADEPDVFWKNSRNHEHKRPTHILRVLIRCEDGQWSRDYTTCANPDAHRFLAFALPNVMSEANCLSEQDYFMANTIRLRDFELMTNTKFFSNRNIYGDEKKRLEFRIGVTERLWSK